MKNFYLKKSFLIISLFSFALLFSCSSKNSDTTETTILTEIQAVPKPIEELSKELSQTTPVPYEKTTSQIIEESLLLFYNLQFNASENKIKAVGYKIFLIEDAEPGRKNAYGFNQYMEYNIENGELVFEAGNGVTPFSINFTMITGDFSFFEVLTDDDYQSENFLQIPEAVRNKMLERNEEDIKEVHNKLEAMIKTQYKEITGNDYTGTLTF